MGFFNKYPYTDFHELNLDWVLQTVKLMGEKIDNFINFNSIKYADPLAWNITTQYAANTVVIDPATGIAYLSTQAVPSGVVITDQDYWTAIFDMSAFFDDIGDLDDLLTTDKSNIVNAINEIVKRINDLDFVTPELFGAKADGVTDDSDAIQQALDFAHDIGKKVRFSPVTYAIEKSLIIQSGLKIEGRGATIDATTPLALVGGAGYGVFTNKVDDALHDFTMIGLTIRVNRNTMHGVYCYHPDGMHDLSFDGVTVYNPQYDGILCHGSDLGYGDSQSYLDSVNSLKHYRVNNCTFINENTNEQTRCGIMLENSHDVVVSNCYAKGFHTGFHCEGVNDGTFISCVAVDNNNDFQRDDTDYHGDFMIGRSENIMMISCTARRIDHPYSFVYDGIGTRTYRTLYMPNFFMKNFRAIGCSFVKGDVLSDEAGATLDNTKIGLSFSDCIFNSANLIFTTAASTLYHDIVINGCTFEKAHATLTRIEELSIIGNAFYNTDSEGPDIEFGFCVNGAITDNQFTDGYLDSGSYWLTGQLKASACSDLKFTSNMFILTNDQSAKPSIGLYSCERMNIIDNTIKAAAIYYSIWPENSCANSIVKNNVFKYDTPDATDKGIRVSMFTGNGSIMADNINITQ